MTEYRTILERDLERITRPAGFTFDDLERRRGRKRRNQRIAAGVVGIAVFVGAVWTVTSEALLDRSETSVVPGGAGMTATTGPTATGPAATGSTAAADAVWNGYGLPPGGLAPSTPVDGEVVARFAKMHVGLVLVYADGRVIWMKAATGSLYEQHLTREGVDLVLSGAVEPATFLEGWYEVPDLPPPPCSSRDLPGQGTDLRSGGDAQWKRRIHPGQVLRGDHRRGFGCRREPQRGRLQA
jgi:hypothetical protein